MAVNWKRIMAAISVPVILVVMILWVMPVLGWRLCRVEGHSMEPAFQNGNMAVMRRAGTYQVGDVVGYHSTEGGRVVFHRIVAGSDGVFIVKGDNNKSVDRQAVTSDEIVGRCVLRIPGNAILVVTAGMVFLCIVWMLGVCGISRDGQGREDRKWRSGR